MEKKKNDKKSKLESGSDQLNVKAMNAAMTIAREYSSVTPDTDPLGSWTGNPDDPYEEPVQDADDL